MLLTRPTVAGREGIYWDDDHSMPPGVSSAFGPRVGGTHHGQDDFWIPGRPETLTVWAASGGGVQRIYWDDALGNCVEVWIAHGVYVRYCHLKTVLVELHQETNPESTPIGFMGDTGSEAGGTHLHFELWINGERVDPEPYFTKHIPGTAIVAPPAPAPAPVVPVPVPSPVEEPPVPTPAPEIPTTEEPIMPAPTETVTLTLEQLTELTRPGTVEGKRPPVPDWLAYTAYWVAAGTIVAAPLLFGQLALDGVITGDRALQQIALLEAAAGGLAGITGVARYVRAKVTS